MADFVGKSGVRLRAHAKTHKSPIIAAKQMELGAVGVCCQKVSEAEVLVEGGIGDVLVSNEVAGAGEARSSRGPGEAAPRLRCASTIPATWPRWKPRPPRPASTSTCWWRSMSARSGAASRRACRPSVNRELEMLRVSLFPISSDNADGIRFGVSSVKWLTIGFGFLAAGPSSYGRQWLSSAHFRPSRTRLCRRR